MKVKKIISGGQTGADRGGLLAGKDLGLETGGTAPYGYYTETGPDLSLKDFGLVEDTKESSMVEGYRQRTRKNILDSDGTLLMGDTSSPGSKLTLRLCNELDKPWVVNPTPSVLKRWLDIHLIEVLNVAGNRESKHPGIQKETSQLLYSVLGD